MTLRIEHGSLWFLSLCLFGGCTISTPSPEKPNIILVMADDLGWGDTGYNGNPEIMTPNLDEMSRNGIQFNRFYASSPVCSPTRGSCLTGRHPYRYGIHTANHGHLPKQEVTLAEVLKEQGYSTGHFGKWHLGTLSPDYSGKGDQRKPRENFSPPGVHGFDEWFSTEFAVATWNPYEPKNSHLQQDIPWDSRALYWQNGKNVEIPLKGCDSKIIMDRALSFIEKAVGKKTPLLAVIWFHAPHAPVIGGPYYREMYPQQPEDNQHYYAAVTALDDQVGRLGKALNKLGIADNTLIWFCSDNGPEGNPGRQNRHQGKTGPFRGRKRSLYEGGVRVPGLLVWPDRINKPFQIDMAAVTSDLFPTILDILDIQVPGDRPYDGISLLSAIEGRTQERLKPIGFRHGQQASLVDNRFKLVHNSGTEKHRSDNGAVPYSEWELYDLLDDPSETENIAEQHPEIVGKMKNLLEEWLLSCEESEKGGDNL